MPKKFLKKYLSDSDLNEIENKISEVEAKTSGEIRVCIKVKRGIYESGLSTREIAIREFHNNDMHLTSSKTGILIFILFDEKKFEVIADEGIYEKIPDEEWDVVRKMIREKFRQAKYKDGIMDVIDEMGSLLIKEFPADRSNVNELSNEVVVK